MKMGWNMDNTGKLYICGTPIGNLEDATIRLLKTLRRVDCIACEDTRHTAKLLNHFKIKKRLISYHQHSNQKRIDYILNEVRNGNSVALVTDAGMPGISDPGEMLIKQALEAELPIEVVPGPSAFTAALAVCGLESSSFLFIGFLPSRSGQRRSALKMLEGNIHTLLIYEAPHRLLKTLEDMMEIWGERPAAVARELTKIHEEVYRGTLSKLLHHYREFPPRGEICLVVAGMRTPRQEEVDLNKVAQEVERLIEGGVTKKEAFQQKAREYGMKRSDLYNYYENRSKK